MVDRVLDHTADMRTNAEPASSSRLAGYYVLMLFVSDLTDSRHALEKDQSQFAGGHTHKSVLAFLGHELRRRTGGAHKDADRAIRDRMARSQQLLDLRVKYFDEYRKFLTAEQVARLYLLEHEIMERLSRKAEQGGRGK